MCGFYNQRSTDGLAERRSATFISMLDWAEPSTWPPDARFSSAPERSTAAVPPTAATDISQMLTFRQSAAQRPEKGRSYVK